MRFVGVDLHRDFGQVAFLEGGKVTGQVRVSTRPAQLQAFAESLSGNDHVIVESTSFAWPVVALLRQHAGQVTVSNPLLTRAIAFAKVKTDKIDAAMLARLGASGMIPEVWIPDADTQILRRKASHRARIVRHRRRLRNQVSSMLQRNLIKPPMSEVYCKPGREWLAAVELPADERSQLDSLLRMHDALEVELRYSDIESAEIALDDARCRLLMTMPGIGPHSAIALVSSIGDPKRFPSPQNLVAYFGLDPRVHQSGNGPFRTGKISKHGDGHARAMMIEAAWGATRVPGPLRAFYKRLRHNKPAGVALVAVARKMTIIAHRMLTTGETYRYEMPCLTERKLRRLEDTCARKPKHSQSAYQHRRHQERQILEAHERAYATFANERSRKK